MRHKDIHWLYTSIIRPSIFLASFIWGHGCQRASVKIRLSRVQRLACFWTTGAMGTTTTTTSVMEALTCLPPLELLVQSETRFAAHHLWSLGCWCLLHPNQGYSSILTQLQQPDPIFNMGVNVMRLAFNSELKNMVTMMPREEWTRGPGTPTVVQGLVWFTDGSTMEGTGAAVYGKSVGRRLSISLER